MTETSPVTHMSPVVNGKLGSCGEPVSRTKAKIVDVNTGEALGPGQEGELCVYGPQIMKGYYNNIKATEEIIDPSGWLHTGDIAYYDEDNQFHVVDRLKELIKVKGLQVTFQIGSITIIYRFFNIVDDCFKVAPSELEDMLRKHPAVLDVAVIGIPDEAAGELPRAYVVPKPNNSVKESDIASYIDSQVAPHKRLKGGLHFIDSIPKTNTGKILRRELKAQLSIGKLVNK